MTLYEIVLSSADGEESFFSDRRPAIDETLRLGDEEWQVVCEDPSDVRDVAARVVCRPAGVHTQAA